MNFIEFILIYDFYIFDIVINILRFCFFFNMKSFFFIYCGNLVVHIYFTYMVL